MPIKSMLSIVGTFQPDEMLTEAIELAQSTGAHLAMMVTALAPPFPTTEYAMVPDLWIRAREAQVDALQRRLVEVRVMAARQASDAEIGSKYLEAESAQAVFGRWARCVDLTVIHASLLADRDLAGPVVGGALFESGRPALFVPFGVRPTLHPRRTMVAWDGSLEAARSVGGSLEMLSCSDEVVVAIVDADSEQFALGGEAGADLAGYLLRHGAKVRIDRLPSLGQPVARVIASHARETGAELLVMGAYGHSRLRERVLGGVTHSILESFHLPIIMAH